MAACPLANASAEPPSSSPIAASSPRRVGLSDRPYPLTPGPATGSRWYGAANTGPGRNGWPGSGAGSPAWTTRVPSCMFARLHFAAHQQLHRDPGIDALVADAFHLLGYRHLDPARSGQVPDRQAALHTLGGLPGSRLRRFQGLTAPQVLA